MAEKKQIHSGHRQRMHDRVRDYGFDSLAEHEALEYLLYFTNARKNTNPIAHALIERFGSFAGVLEASEEELCAVEGVGPATARLIHLLPSFSRYYRRSCAKERRRLTTSEQIGEYLMAQFHGKRQEEVLLVALDDQGRIGRTAWVGAGGADRVGLPVKKVVAEALRMGASGVVLSHNHPGGNVLPSREDLAATEEIVRGLAMVEIQLLDHVIVTETEYCSLRQENRMPLYDVHSGQVLLASRSPRRPPK